MHRRASTWLVLAAAGCGVGAGIYWSAGPWFAVTAGLYAAAHVVLFPNPSGRGVTLTPGVAAAVALGTNGSPVMVLGAAAAALPVGLLAVHLRFGRRTLDRIFPSEQLGLAVFGGAFAAGVTVFGIEAQTDAAGLVVLLIAGLAWFGTSALFRATWSRQRRALPRRLLLSRALDDWPAYAALMSSAALFELTDEAVGAVWAALLAGLPYAFSHLSLHRVQTTRHTYRQTIEALGRIPEAGGLVAAGTAQRVADLCVATAAECGLFGRALDRVEFAALLHEIGRVVLANPAVAAGEYSARDVAGWSAAIISEARYLEPVAHVILAEQEPYRRFGQARDPGVPIASKVVRAVSAYVAAIHEGVSPVEALEVLHRGAAYQYDPDVVGALRRVLERREAIAA